MDEQIKASAMAEAIRVIDCLGGTAKVARLCNTTQSAVSQWKENGIPDYRLMFLKLARPDAFPKSDCAANIKDDAGNKVLYDKPLKLPSNKS